MSRAIFASPLVVLVPIVTLLAARYYGGERRSHFGLRVVILCLFVPAVVAILIGLALLLQWPDDASLPLLLLLLVLNFAGLMFVEPILFSTSDASSGRGGDGWGHGPGEPPSSPDRPRGGLPLADSEVGRWRLRDHSWLGGNDARSRRSAREPERVRAL